MLKSPTTSFSKFRYSRTDLLRRCPDLVSSDEDDVPNVNKVLDFRAFTFLDDFPRDGDVVQDHLVVLAIQWHRKLLVILHLGLCMLWRV